MSVSRALTQGERYDGETETFVTSGLPTSARVHDANGVAPTLQASKTDNRGGSEGPITFTSSAGVRRLTPVECERLQGFPDGWTAYGPDSRRYAALGDAVTVNVAQWIGERLLRYG